MDVLRRAYEAFNARDIEAALELMHADVDWPNGMEGGRVAGRDAVRAYWTRQFGMIDSRVDPSPSPRPTTGASRSRVNKPSATSTARCSPRAS